MSDDLIKLEMQREQLYQRMQSIGDFRRGSISVTFCKCGKKNCACAAKDHPGHGPHYRWTTTRKGKSFAQHLHLGPELDKARKEIGAYKQFDRLCQEVVELNEQICRLRPVPKIDDECELEALKKKFGKKSSRNQERSRQPDYASFSGQREFGCLRSGGD